MISLLVVVGAVSAAFTVPLFFIAMLRHKRELQRRSPPRYLGRCLGKPWLGPYDPDPDA